MDELGESSLLFSLESLLETERERVQREAREAQRRREDELKRVAELGERRRLQTQQEREARERRQRIEQERERIEQERIDAMKRATVERARIEAEGQLRLVEVEQARQHDLALAKIHEAQRTARYRSFSWLSTSALGLVVVGAGLAYFALLRPAHAQSEQHWQALLSVAEQRQSESEGALGRMRSENQELRTRVRELEARPLEPASAPPKIVAPGHRGGTGGRPPVADKTPERPCVDNGDPLNPCLKRHR